MNIEQQKVLATLANPKWQAQMDLDLIDSQARQAEHDKTVRTMESLISHAHQKGDADMEAFWRRCLAKYQGEVWDLL